MDARRGLLLLVGLSFFANSCFGQKQFVAESTNFVVYAADPTLVKQVAHQAETYRKSLALEWLGHELDDWKQKCPIRVELAPQPGGETTFAFVGPPGQSEPIEWSMKIFGPQNRLLDAVLPHEVTHTIFATHFGRPLPRWADEGACTTVEHVSERQKIQKLLLQFLAAKPSKGIPFNQLFVLMQYPSDMLPLYAQSYSLARYLILLKGRQHFIKFVEAGLEAARPGMETRAWDAVTKEYYGFKDLSELQLSWIKWVKVGSPENNLVERESRVGENSTPEIGTEANMPPPERFVSTPATNLQNSWYHQQMKMAEKAPIDSEGSEDPMLIGNSKFEPRSTSRFADGKLETLRR